MDESPAEESDANPAADTTPAADASPAADAKERYRQALEQKNERGGHGASGASGGSTSAKGTSAKAGGKREFRRKSG